MSWSNNKRWDSAGERAPFPAKNRQFNSEDRVNGTSTIYCYGCNQTKIHHAFSESQLKKAGSRNPDKKHQPMCKACTPTQSTTKTCSICLKTLSLENFTKSQKRRKEDAMCVDCREYIDTNDPDVDLDIHDDPDLYDGDIRDVL